MELEAADQDSYREEVGPRASELLGGQEQSSTAHSVSQTCLLGKWLRLRVSRDLEGSECRRELPWEGVLPDRGRQK